MNENVIRSIVCDCCDTDKEGNLLNDPCCDFTGICEAFNVNPHPHTEVSNCMHCGAEMFLENGLWWHYSQSSIPIDMRSTIHLGLNLFKLY